MLGAIALGVPLSGWGALYPDNTWLQVGPVALALPGAVWALRRWPISNAAAGCVTAFILLHLFAARWSYSFVPYHDWLGALFGGFDDGASFHRNMFDRLVHFLFGALTMVPAAEIARRYGGMGRIGAMVFALLFVLAVGGFYEIFEWLLAVAMSPAHAEAYNGQQGDMFDSQKDMACAAVGALLMLPFARRIAAREP